MAVVLIALVGWCCVRRRRAAREAGAGGPPATMQAMHVAPSGLAGAPLGRGSLTGSLATVAAPTHICNPCWPHGGGSPAACAPPRQPAQHSVSAPPATRVSLRKRQRSTISPHATRIAASPLPCPAGVQAHVSIVPGVKERFDLTEVVEQTGSPYSARRRNRTVFQSDSPHKADAF